MPRFNLYDQARRRDLGTYDAPDSDAAVEQARQAGVAMSADLIVSQVGLPPIRCGQFVTVKLGGDHLLWLACSDEEDGLLRITPLGPGMTLPPIHTVRRDDVIPASDGRGAPGPDAIVALRKAAGLTQTDAADLVSAKLRTWQDWEGGTSRMHAGLWELFVDKATRARRPA